MIQTPLRPSGRTSQHTHAFNRWTRWARILLTIVLLLTLVMAPWHPTPALAATNHQSSAEVALRWSTPVVTDKSGYTLRAAVTNTANQPMENAHLSVSTNALYSFSSRADMQAWSEGHARIPTPDVLGTQTVPTIPAGQSVEVAVNVPADQDAIKKMTSWGPKPVRLSLSDDQDQVLGDVFTFLTRTWDGLPTAGTPALALTMVMPLTSSDWNIDDKAMTALMTQSSPGDDKNRSVTLTRQGARRQGDQSQLLTKHGSLQALGDPVYLSAFANRPQIQGLIQPADFDITGYASQNQDRYAQAGVTPGSWSAKTSAKLYADSAPDTYAWQGRQEWTMESITAARRAGYQTVIAPQGFEVDAGTSAHTGKYTIETKAGKVTVLSAQRELSNLARGHPSSTRATGEQTQAGQTARFIAQSAFYQMEQPYAERSLLVCFDTDEDTQQADRIMTELEHAPWISLKSMDDLMQAPDFTGGSSGLLKALELGNTKGSAKHGDGSTGTLDSLIASRSEIDRFATTILADGKQDSQPTASATAGKTDSQALARQDADATARQPKDPHQWLSQLTAAHDDLALKSLGGTAAAAGLADQAEAISHRLLDGVSITPSESLNVVSETASMPVTVSNSHPYPVHARISARTDSMEIVTSRMAEVVIPARSEAQVTFKVRVAAAGRANVDIGLLDRQGRPFGQVRRAQITSNLRLSDMSGLIIIVIAVLLGLLGLWRQFHRTKDPDE
ncbi:hypothetical protein CI603_01695 [Bifidobacterium sp. wkB338]|uniref:DUF6049 family protein n=1 Tax=Bifidobacterium sp. wkB338 TaxID=2025114 RepID=UPI000EF9871F|nr:DUF6049 family protein [Bifidobacterium sp. wkB338]RMA46969.1 hypothetical protein CI603_01695 [Bifidobacterium sp. wkB338]